MSGSQRTSSDCKQAAAGGAFVRTANRADAIGEPRRAGRSSFAVAYGLVWLGCSLSLFAVFTALPPFLFGIWVQNEPVSAAVHGAAAITSFGLSVLVWSGSVSAARSLLHPVTVVPAALALWSLAMSSFASYPALSWLGAPEHGEGVLYYLELCVLTAGALVLRRRRGFWRWLYLLGLLSALLVSIPSILQGEFLKVAPYHFPDFSAFFGIYTLVIALSLRPLLLRAAGLLLGALIVAHSSNWTAMGLTFVAAPLVYLLVRFTGLPVASAVGIRVGIALSAPVLMTVLVATEQLGGASIASRAHLLEIVLQTFVAEPWRLFSGIGWGHYGEVLLAHAPLEGVTFVSGGPGQAWDALARGDFHSHNFAGEALLSSGVLGMAIILAIPATVVVYSSPRAAAVATAFAFVLGGLWSLWFQYPAGIPLLAVSIASLVTRAPPHPRLTTAARNWRRIIGTFAAAAGLGLAGGAAAVAEMGIGVQQIHSEAASLSADCEHFFPVDGRGGYHLAWSLRWYAWKVSHSEATPGEMARLTCYIRSVERQLADGASLRLAVSDLVTRADFAFLPDFAHLQPLRERYLATWGTHVAALLERAPERTDLAIPYFIWLLESGREEELVDVTDRILALNSRDPTGLWFSGVVLAGQPSAAEAGLTRMRQSLAEGIERFMPVDPNIREALRP